MGLTTYQKRKEQGVCVDCGINPAKKGIVRCEACSQIRNAQRKKEYYENQAMKRCPCCMKNKLYGDEKICLECAAKRYISCRNWNENNRERRRTLRAERNAQRKANGICPECGKRSAMLNHVLCEICNDKNNQKKKKEFRKKHPIPRVERISMGLCFRCGREIDNDKKVCSKCLGKVHYKPRPQQNHVWIIENRKLFRRIDHG